MNAWVLYGSIAIVENQNISIMKSQFFFKGFISLTGLVIIFMFTASCQNGNSVKQNDTEAGGRDFRPDKWKVYNRNISFIEYKGRSSIQLSEGSGDGFAVLDDCILKDGVIELDIAALPFFTGIVFRAQSDNKYEAIYFRPQNSHHDDPVKRSHTVQYISHPDNTWQYLREKFPGKYETYADLKEDEWFHVRVVVEGIKASVFVNGSDQPCLTIDSLLHGISQGGVGVWCGNTSGGTYTGFKLSELKYMADNSITIESGFNDYQDFLFDIFNSRRSIRGYKPDNIPDEHIRWIIRVAGTAPTAGNQQPWKFLVIKDRNKIGKLLDLQLESELKNRKVKKDQDIDQVRNKIRETLDRYLSAPVFISVLTDDNSKYPSYNIKDGSIAAGYVLIAARALGYGSVFTTDSFSPDNIKKAFNIPENYSQICFIPIGLPVEWPDPPPKKSLAEIMVWENFENNMSLKTRTNYEINTSEYTGKYDYMGEVTLEIILVDNELCMKSTGYEPVPLSMEGKDQFTLAGADYHIHFVRNDDGSIEGIRAVQADTVFFAGKME